MQYRVGHPFAQILGLYESYMIGVHIQLDGFCESDPMNRVSSIAAHFWGTPRSCRRINQ